MDKIWVRNITTDDINKVGSLNFGADEWQNAYSEMIEREYKFQIGRPKGNYNNLWGLYLINPLDIQIRPSKYRIVNDLNDSIKELQDFVNSTPAAEKQRNNNKSLIDLFYELEGAYERAKFISGAAMMFAPSEAIDSTINSQKDAYNKLIESIKVSSQEDRIELLKMVIGSSSLIDNVKLAVILEITNLSEGLLSKHETKINQALIDLFYELEGAYERAKFISDAAMMFAPSEAIDSTINSQKGAYNKLIESIKVSSQEDRIELLKMVIGSSSLIDSAKLAIIIEVLGLQEEYTTEAGKDIPKKSH